MSNGFLGYRASLMLDVVVCALLVVVPLLVFSLYLVKVRKNYLLHRNLQVLLGIVLLIAVGLFEVDMQLQGGIDAILGKRASPLSSVQLALFNRILRVHLFFAISTVFLWAATLILALKKFANPPLPGSHSQVHKVLGWLSAVDITMTAVTGLMVYYFGFVVASG